MHFTSGMDALSTNISPSLPQPFRWNRSSTKRVTVQSLFDDALQHHLAGRIDHAIARYKRALVLDPKHADIHNNLGVAFIAKGRLASAITHYERALVLSPDHFNALNNLGTALVARGKFADAIEHYQYALTISPRHPNTLYNLGIALAALGKTEEAMASYRRALSFHPDYAEAHNNLGNLLLANASSEEAMSHYKRALTIDPDHASARHNMGNILRDQGRFAAALGHFNRAVAINPDSVESHYGRAELKTFRAGDPELAALKALDRKRDEDPYKSIFVQFALGKALEDIGDHAGSFDHLMRGNRLKRSRIDYDERASAETFRRAARSFNPGAGEGNSSQIPIFVVGMPRSGTTLIEQILASHAQIQGAGELQDLAASESVGLGAMAEMYLASLPALANGKIRIVDKQPDNFLRIGLIRQVLPNARIIHCVRNPIDTCVSCYSKLFTTGQNFSYDLGELGRYYRRYSDLMAHWRSALPAGSMLEVTYEDVVDDLEGQARRMIEYCGLEWDERCLSFHKTRRTVKTASAVQVRQPLFRTSVQRWRRCEGFLGPLLHALGEYPTPLDAVGSNGLAYKQQVGGR